MYEITIFYLDKKEATCLHDCIVHLMYEIALFDLKKKEDT